MTNRPEELLAAKQEADKQKRQFAEFARKASGGRGAEMEAGLEFKEHDRLPDQQNHLKDVENLRK